MIVLYRPGTEKKSANYRYAIIARNHTIASQYATHVMRLKRENRIFEGYDDRSPLQQWKDISTIAVSVPDDWNPPTVYMND